MLLELHQEEYEAQANQNFYQQRNTHSFEIYCREFGTERWQQLRISRLELPVDTVFHIGIYACSPKQGGFEAIFHNISIEKWSFDDFKQKKRLLS